MFRGVSHIGIAVKSIDQSLKLFHDVFGLTLSKIEEVPHEGVRVAILPAGETRIELLEPLNESSPLHKTLAKRGEGVHHIAFAAENLDTVIAALKKAGISILGEPRKGAGGSRITFIHPKDGHGVLFEFCQES